MYGGVLDNLGLFLALFGLGFGIYQTWKWQKKFKSYEPLIKRAMSFMGSLGKKAQVDAGFQADVQDALMNGAIQMLAKKHPEIGMVMGYLEENHPDILEGIKEHPEMIISLYEQWQPLISKIMGKVKGESRPEHMYDV